MDAMHCQSCGMPMGTIVEMRGTNADGSTSADYCAYCFEDGVFTVQCSIGEMIELCISHVTSAHPDMSADEARSMMREFFPTLKRWK